MKDIASQWYSRHPERRFSGTERRLQRILFAGFALVLLLMLGSGVVGIFAMRSMQQRTSQMSEYYLVQTSLLDELQRHKAGLGILLYSIAKDGPVPSHLPIYRMESSELKSHISGLVRQALQKDLRPKEAEAWKAVGEASENLFARMDTLIAERQTNWVELSVLHRQFIAEIISLMEISYQDVASARTEELRRDSSLIRNSGLLFTIAMSVAIVCAAACVVGAIAIFQTMERQAETLAQLSIHTLGEQEDVARRLSQDIHDEFGQSLNALHAILSVVEPKDATSQLRLEDARFLSREAQAMAREMSHLLRPRILDDFGLDAGLRELCEGFSRRTGIAVEYRSTLRHRLQSIVETHLFRIAQEALTNISRHTVATLASVSLLCNEQLLSLRIVDNGEGLVENKRQTGLGLLGMQERARTIGARMAIRSTRNGVEVLVEIAFSIAVHAETDSPVTRYEHYPPHESIHQEKSL